MKDNYPLMNAARERNLTIGEVLLTALDVFKARFGAFALLLLMFYLPASAVLGFVAWRMPDLSAIEDPTAYVLALAEAYIPYLLWSFGLQFFLLLTKLVVTLLCSNELFDTTRLRFPAALTESFRSFIPAFTARFAIELSFVTCVLLMVTLLALSPMLGVLLFAPLLIYLTYISLMRHSSAVTAASSSLGGWKNTAFCSMLYRETFWKSLFSWMALCAVVILPQLLLNFLATFCLDFIASPLWAEIAACLLSAVLSVFDIFLDICAVIFVNNYVLLRRAAEDEGQNGED